MWITGSVLRHHRITGRWSDKKAPGKNNPALGRVKSDDGGSRYTERCVGPRRRPNGKPGRVAEPLRFVANARSSAGRFGPRISSLRFNFNFLLHRTAIIAAAEEDPMSAIERLLVPGSTELPACHCGDEMRIASLDPAPESSGGPGGLEIVARGVLFAA